MSSTSLSSSAESSQTSLMSSYLSVSAARAAPMTESLSSLPPRVRYDERILLMTSDTITLAESGKEYSTGTTVYSVCPSSASPTVTDANWVL